VEEEMKKTIITIFAFLILFGFAVSGAKAQTAWWTWDTPKLIDGEPSEYDSLEAYPGYTEVNACVGEVCELISTIEDPLATWIQAEDVEPETEVDSVVSFIEVEYVIDANTVGKRDEGNFVAFPVADQPKVPSVWDDITQAFIPMDGEYKSIAVGIDGTLYVLFEATAGETTGDQYLLVGNPPHVTARFTPRRLNLGSQGKWITCKISGLPEGYSTKGINLDSIRIVGINDDYTIDIPHDSTGPVGNGRKLMVKFDRQVLIEAIGEVNGNVDLTLIGTWGEEELPFFATDTFKTKFKIKKNPK
jgi:hypothetical protein